MSESSPIDVYSLPIGFTIGGYTIRKVIGHGGFGITYLVHDEELDNNYALKENMPRIFCSRDSRTKQVTALEGESTEGGYEWALVRFKDEARTLAKLNHPGIVRVLRSFDALGTSYYVMDKIDGQELDRATENRRDEAFLRHILRRLLHALQYLHQKNILHRDIKPANILLTQEDEPILIDFGTARSLITEHTHTQLKSQGYTPFEQIQTKGEPGPWTDLYALGATFYKLITGDTPPDSTDRILDDPYRPLAGREELKGVYSDSFLRSIDKALTPLPKGRCQSAEEWLARLNDTASANETARQAQEELDRRLAEAKAAEEAAAALAEQARRTQEEYDRRIAALKAAEKANDSPKKEHAAAQETEVADLEAPKHFSFTKNGKPFHVPYRSSYCTFSADGNWCLFKSNMEAHLCEVKSVRRFSLRTH